MIRLSPVTAYGRKDSSQMLQPEAVGRQLEIKTADARFGQWTMKADAPHPSKLRFDPALP